jgi:PAS domain S-box-containing protein
MNGNNGETKNGKNKTLTLYHNLRKSGRLQYILILLIFILLIASAVFFIINVHQVVTETAISSYQTNELEIVRETARAIQEYVHVQTVVLGRTDISNIEQEVYTKFVDPIRLLKSGDAWIYAPDHIVFDQSADLPKEYWGRSMAEIFALQKNNGARHYEEMTADVTNAREGVGYYVWLPEKGSEIAAWTPVRVGNYTWTIGLSTPLPEILDATGASAQIALFTYILLASIIIALVLLLIWIITDMRRRRVEEALGESESEYRNILRTAMDGFCIVDMTGSFIDVNDAFCKILGYSREEILSLSLRSIEVIETPEDIARHMKEIIRKGEDRFETRYRCKDGRVINMEVSVVLTGDQKKHFVTFHRDITERKMAEDALNRATKKLNLLNFITFNDIQNAIFALSAYIELEKHIPMNEKQQQYMDKQIGIVRTITESLTFANQYQNLGLKPPAWLSVTQTFLFGISHLDISAFSRKLDVEGLEIYTDMLIEQVFFTLAENVVVHGKTATEIRLYYQKSAEGLTLIFEDDGTGIPKDMKEKIFERRSVEKKGLGLFLAREILDITGMTIKETGEPGKGARFEITVPKGAYRSGSVQ